MGVVLWSPAHTVNEVSCGVGGVVQWPCGMCVQCGLMGSVCYMWDWLQASSSQRNWMVHVWAWSCSSLPVQLPGLLWYYMKILGSRGHTP